MFCHQKELLGIKLNRRIANVGNQIITAASIIGCSNRTKNNSPVRVTGEVPTNYAFELLNNDRLANATYGYTFNRNFNWQFHNELKKAAHVAEELDTFRWQHVGGCSSILNRVSVARL